MNYTEPKVIYTCFPGGKHKVLTMSYDDGRLEDRRLVELFNRYGIRGTFNLNGGLPRPERIPESEWVELYKGHEVACHTYHHPHHLPQPAGPDRPAGAGRPYAA